MKSSVVAPGWLLIFTELLRESSRPFTCMIHLIVYNKNLFPHRRSTFRLSFDQVTIVLVSNCCYFIIVFIRGGLFMGYIDLFISGSINSMIIRKVICYVSIYSTSFLSWMTRQHWWFSKFKLCSSKESIKCCLLPTSFFKNLFPVSEVSASCFSEHVCCCFFSLESGCSVKTFSCKTFNSFLSRTLYLQNVTLWLIFYHLVQWPSLSSRDWNRILKSLGKTARWFVVNMLLYKEVGIYPSNFDVR